MKKRKPLDARQLARERLLFRYSAALERGDFETVENILQEAGRDPLLDRMIHELDEAYAAEYAPISAPQPVPFSTNHINHQEKHSMNLTLNNRALSPRSSAGVLRSSYSLPLAAAVIAAVFGVLLFMQRPNPNPQNMSLAQGDATATATWTPTAVPSASPTWTSTPAAFASYTFEEGDTLGHIALTFNISIQDLVNANPDVFGTCNLDLSSGGPDCNMSTIAVGKTLLIPLLAPTVVPPQPAATLWDANGQPLDAEGVLQLCESYTREGQIQQAVVTCSTLLTTNPQDARVYRQLGVLDFMQRNYEGAIQNFEQCAALGSEDIQCYYMRGLANFYLNNCDQAVNLLLDSLEKLRAEANPDQSVMNIVIDGLLLARNNCAAMGVSSDGLLPGGTSSVGAALVTLVPPGDCGVVTEAWPTFTPIPFGSAQPTVPQPSTLLPSTGVAVAPAALETFTPTPLGGTVNLQPTFTLVPGGEMVAVQPCTLTIYPTLIPTPTSAFFTPGASAVTAIQIGTIPPGTPVTLTSGLFDGTQWIYTVSTADGQIITVYESQLVLTTNSDLIPSAGVIAPVTATPFPATIPVITATPTIVR